MVHQDWLACPQPCGNNNNNKKNKKTYVGNTSVLNIAQCFEATESQMNDAFDTHGTDKIMKYKTQPALGNAQQCLQLEFMCRLDSLTC